MLQGDISPSPGTDGVSDSPGHAAAPTTCGHSSQVVGQGKHRALGVGAAPRVTQDWGWRSAPGNPPSQELSVKPGRVSHNH